MPKINFLVGAKFVERYFDADGIFGHTQLLQDVSSLSNLAIISSNLINRVNRTQSH